MRRRPCGAEVKELQRRFRRKSTHHQGCTQISASAKGAGRVPRGRRRRHHRQRTANRPLLTTVGSMLVDSATALGHVCALPSWRRSQLLLRPTRPRRVLSLRGLLSTSPNPANAYAANTRAANANSSVSVATYAANANSSVSVATHAANANPSVSVATPTSVAVAAPTQTSAVKGSAVVARCVAVGARCVAVIAMATRCGVTVAAGAPAPTAPTEGRGRSAFKGKERCGHRQRDNKSPYAHLITPVRHSPL